MEADKHRISAEQHSKMVGLACACRMLGELRLFTGDRDSRYWLNGLAEVGDAFVGRRNSSASEVRTDAFLVLLLDVSPRHEPKPNLHEILNEWLPKVRVVISTFNSIQAGIIYNSIATFKSISSGCFPLQSPIQGTSVAGTIATKHRCDKLNLLTLQLED